jgi:hypothetical protein
MAILIGDISSPDLPCEPVESILGALVESSERRLEGDSLRIRARPLAPRPARRASVPPVTGRHAEPGHPVDGVPALGAVEHEPFDLALQIGPHVQELRVAASSRGPRRDRPRRDRLPWPRQRPCLSGCLLRDHANGVKGSNARPVASLHLATSEPMESARAAARNR